MRAIAFLRWGSFCSTVVGFFSVYALMCGAYAASPLPSATDQDDVIIKRIVVEGQRRIEAATVRSYLSLKEGDRYSMEAVDDSIKKLFASGLFSDVATVRDGMTLVVKVTENPIINLIAFEGNRKLKDDVLKAEIQLRRRQVYTRVRVREDVRRILRAYRRAGRFAVTITPQVIRLSQNRLNLVFKIDEGKPAYVKRINMIGNHHYGDDQLRDVIYTREERWYRFLSSVDTYDPDRMALDRQALRHFYLTQGYADFRLSSAVSELSPDLSGFFITFTVAEGERYKFGDLGVKTSLPGLDEKRLLPVIVGKRGDWYNADLIEDTVQALTDAVGTFGYAFVDVRPLVKRDSENHVVDIVYDVREGPITFIDRIDITGNTSTRDRVIRREMRLVEGDAFNSALLRRSRARIRNLGFFSSVDIATTSSAHSSDSVDIEVKVQEEPSGYMQFNVGYGQGGGAFFKINFREPNLLGKGQDLSLSTTLAQRGQEINLGFTEPYFLDLPLAAGFDIFHERHDREDTSSYNWYRTGTRLRFGFNYNEFLGHSIHYTLSRNRVAAVDAAASNIIKQQEGEAWLSMVGQSLVYDRRDNARAPTTGYLLRVSNDVAGLGGDEKFIRMSVDGEKFFSLSEGVVLSLNGEAAIVRGLGEDVRFVRNYMLGGDTLRGFRYGGASPRDKDSGDALGGSWMARGTAQLRFPLGLPKELGLSGSVFSDVGFTGPPEGVDKDELNYSSKPRASAGVGLVWNSFLGVIAVGMAKPIMKEDFDRERTFVLSLGRAF